MYLFDGLFGGLLIQFKWITTYYCLYTLFTLCFLLFAFLFFFFFSSARTNPAKVVDKKQSTHDATAIGKLQTQYSVSIIVVMKYQSNISFWQSTNFAKLELHPFVFTWAVTKTAVSSHSFTSFCNLFLIKGNPLSVIPKKKNYRNKFWLIWNKNYSRSKYYDYYKKSHQRSSKVSYPKCLPSLMFYFLIKLLLHLLLLD